MVVLCPRHPISINSSIRRRNGADASRRLADCVMRNASSHRWHSTRTDSKYGFDSWDALRTHVKGWLRC